MSRLYYPNSQLIFFFAFLVAINLITMLPSPALADLPPRPEPPGRASEAGSDSDAGNPIGGYIALKMSAASPEIWTMVQWQDQAGMWHDIEGWQGTLDDGRQKVWWIDPADFGKGPFRWVVYQGQNGKLLANSSSFNLPGTAYETVSAEIEALPTPSTSQPGNTPTTRRAPVEETGSFLSPSTPDFLPVTGGEPRFLPVTKLALIWGVLLGLILQGQKFLI